MFFWFVFKRTVWNISPLSSSYVGTTFLPPGLRRYSAPRLNREHAEPRANKKPSDHGTYCRADAGFSTFSSSEHFKHRKVCLLTKDKAEFALSYTQESIYCSFVKGWAASRCCLLLFFDANSWVERGISKAAAFVWCGPSHLGGVEGGGWRGARGTKQTLLQLRSFPCL